MKNYLILSFLLGASLVFAKTSLTNTSLQQNSVFVKRLDAMFVFFDEAKRTNSDMPEDEFNSYITINVLSLFLLNGSRLALKNKGEMSRIEDKMCWTEPRCILDED